MRDNGRLLSELVERYQEELLRVCFIYLRERHLAEDAVQETFLKAYKALPDFREESLYKTWLTRIAINTCRDMRRRAYFRLVLHGFSGERAPAEDFEEREESMLVTAAIAKLPEKLKTAVILYYYQDMTVDDAAETLGISQSSFSERLKRAREKLRETLKGEYFDE